MDEPFEWVIAIGAAVVQIREMEEATFVETSTSQITKCNFASIGGKFSATHYTFEAYVECIAHIDDRGDKFVIQA